MLTAFTVVLILAVGYAHLRDGLFTALCMLVNVLLAGLCAFCFFEPLADWLDDLFQQGSFAGYEDFLALVLVFSASLIPLRALTNRLAPDMLDFPPNAQYAGAGFGMISGYFLAGFLICAMETLPWQERFLDFQPRISNDSGPRSVFPPDRVWLSLMRYAGAHAFAWKEEPAGGDTNYDRYLTFDRNGTFELRYLRYRRFDDKRMPLKYQNELDKELYRN